MRIRRGAASGVLLCGVLAFLIVPGVARGVADLRAQRAVLYSARGTSEEGCFVDPSTGYPIRSGKPACSMPPSLLQRIEYAVYDFTLLFGNELGIRTQGDCRSSCLEHDELLRMWKSADWRPVPDPPESEAVLLGNGSMWIETVGVQSLLYASVAPSEDEQLLVRTFDRDVYGYVVTESVAVLFIESRKASVACSAVVVDRGAKVVIQEVDL